MFVSRSRFNLVCFTKQFPSSAVGNLERGRQATFGVAEQFRREISCVKRSSSTDLNPFDLARIDESMAAGHCVA